MGLSTVTILGKGTVTSIMYCYYAIHVIIMTNEQQLHEDSQKYN